MSIVTQLFDNYIPVIGGGGVAGGRVVRALAPAARAVLCAGLWVRVPSPHGHAALPTTGSISDCDIVGTVTGVRNEFSKRRIWA